MVELLRIGSFTAMVELLWIGSFTAMLELHRIGSASAMAEPDTKKNHVMMMHAGIDGQHRPGPGSRTHVEETAFHLPIIC